jgi:hypothetical protein
MTEKTIDEAMRDFYFELLRGAKIPELVDWLSKKIDLFQAKRNIRKSFKKARKVVDVEAFKNDVSGMKGKQ